MGFVVPRRAWMKELGFDREGHWMIPHFTGHDQWWEVGLNGCDGIEALMARHHLYPNPPLDVDPEVISQALIGPSLKEVNMAALVAAWPQFHLDTWEEAEGFTASAPELGPGGRAGWGWGRGGDAGGRQRSWGVPGVLAFWRGAASDHPATPPDTDAAAGSGVPAC